jgi:16S rRNA (uracil1498-N3)-methyltransferase
VTDLLRSSSAHVFVDDIDDPALADEDLHHLARVLRLRDGEPVSVCDGRGSWRMTQWRDGALLAAGAIVRDPAPPAVAVAFAPVKGDRSESAVEKMVEIGVGRIIVLAPTEHSVVRWDAARAEANIAEPSHAPARRGGPGSPRGCDGRRFRGARRTRWPAVA